MPPAIRKWLIRSGVWAVLFIAAILLDGPCARLSRQDVAGAAALEAIRKPHWTWPGHFYFTFVIAVGVVCIRQRNRWRAGGFILLAGALSGTHVVLKWAVGRTRPMKGLAPWDLRPFRDGLRGLFHQTNLSMPSGDVALAVATAAALGMLWPRLRVLWYALAVLVAAQRVIDNAHYLSDIVVAAAFGVLSTAVAARIVKLPPAGGDSGAASTIPALDHQNHG